MIDNLLNMSNEEFRTWFRTEVIESTQDPEWERRLKEYHDNIERDFQEEWSKKHFKWFFKKRRQKKLREKIVRRYSAPVFWLLEEVFDDLWPEAFQYGFDEFVDVKNIGCETPDDDDLREGDIIHTSARALRAALVDQKENNND